VYNCIEYPGRQVVYTLLYNVTAAERDDARGKKN